MATGQQKNEIHTRNDMDETSFSVKYRDYFDENISVLKQSGLWVPLDLLSNRKSQIVQLRNILIIVYAMGFFTVAQLIALPENTGAIDDLIKNLNMSLSFLLTLSKIYVWFTHRVAILKLTTYLVDSLAMFDDVRRTFDVDVVLGKERTLIYRLTAVYYVLARGVPGSACLSSLYTTIFDYKGDNYETVTTDASLNTTVRIYTQKLPYYSWVPFPYQINRIAFGCAVVYQCSALYFCGLMAIGFDTFYAALVNLLSTHMKLLQGAFKTINLNAQRHTTNKAGLGQATNTEMTKWIKHLQHMLEQVSICEKIESFYTYLILQQSLISLVVLCTCLYLVSSIPFGTKLLFESIYMMAIINQLSLYCYVGDKVTFRTAKIGLALYESDWLGADLSYKRSMLITMARLQKPLYMTIGKFSPLTLTTLVTIVRGSYSLLAVVKSQE